ncbi:hypothetical protein ACFY2K_42680 [Kitasatospora sp. NPDC001309]|uniref:hypothetical protein n=1 Tax=Kitasatospora sp. NPDC001309 TaxID=3364013 RepID=UPI0036B4D578
MSSLEDPSHWSAWYSDDTTTPTERRQRRAHEEHDHHDDDCWLCEDERNASAGYTRCGKCALPYPEGRFSALWHNAPYCMPLPVIPADSDWAALLGRRVELVGTHYTVTGVIVPEQPLPRPGTLRPYLQFDRTDSGADHGIGPISPREWLEIRVLG